MGCSGTKVDRENSNISKGDTDGTVPVEKDNRLIARRQSRRLSVISISHGMRRPSMMDGGDDLAIEDMPLWATKNMGNSAINGQVVPKSDSAEWTRMYHNRFDDYVRSTVKVEAVKAFSRESGISGPPRTSSWLEETYEPPHFPISSSGRSSIRWSSPNKCMEGKQLTLVFELEHFRNSVLDAMNEYRAIHGCPLLVLDDELNQTALTWARMLADKEEFHHSTSGQRRIDRGKVGENLAKIINCPYNFNPGKNYADVNYKNEEPLYDYANPGFSKATGQFTQMIWRDSKCVGLGVAHVSRDNKTYMIVVEHYYPAGNVTGKFEWNVFPKFTTDEGIDKVMDIIKNPPQFDDEQLLKYRDQSWKTHNTYRRLHGAPVLELDDELCELAQATAERIGFTKQFESTDKSILTLPGGLVGECLDRIGFVSSVSTYHGRNAVNRMYREIEDFNFHELAHSDATDRVEQVLWRSTKKLGVGTVKYFNGRGIIYLTVFHYFPARDGDINANIFPVGFDANDEIETVKVATKSLKSQTSALDKMSQNSTLDKIEEDSHEDSFDKEQHGSEGSVHQGEWADRKDDLLIGELEAEDLESLNPASSRHIYKDDEIEVVSCSSDEDLASDALYW